MEGAKDKKNIYPGGIILFDGVCNLCNGAVQFVLKHDPKGYFSFASLQSDIGQKLLDEYHINPAENDSIVLIENGKAYLRSSAALHIARKLNAAWPTLYLFMAVPRPIRNGVSTG